MRDKIIKIILTILPIILAIAFIGTNIRSCSIRSSDRERAERLEQRARKFEEKYAEANQLYSQTFDVLRRTKIELEHIRTSHKRLEELTGELDAENKRLGTTVINLEKLYGELTSGIGSAQELIQATDGEARRALDIVERLQDGSKKTD